MPKIFNDITVQVEWLCRRHSLDRYAEDILRHNQPMVVPQAFNGITIQIEWLYRRQSLDRYAEDIQRHNHPMITPKTFNGTTIQVEWLYRRHSTTYHPSWIVMLKTVNGLKMFKMSLGGGGGGVKGPRADNMPRAPRNGYPALLTKDMSKHSVSATGFKIVSSGTSEWDPSVASWLAHLPFTSKVAGSCLNEDFSMWLEPSPHVKWVSQRSSCRKSWVFSGYSVFLPIGKVDRVG
jgi:hypothetical protein